MTHNFKKKKLMIFTMKRSDFLQLIAETQNYKRQPNCRIHSNLKLKQNSVQRNIYREKQRNFQVQKIYIIYAYQDSKDFRNHLIRNSKLILLMITTLQIILSFMNQLLASLLMNFSKRDLNMFACFLEDSKNAMILL